MFIIFFTGIFCLVGFVFVVVGWILRKNEQKKRACCVGQVWGKIIGFQSHYSSDGTTYSPIYEFTIGEETIVHHSHVSSSHISYYEGQNVKINYDPHDYQCSYIEGDKTQSRLSLFFIIFGSVFMLVGLIVGFIVGVS